MPSQVSLNLNCVLRSTSIENHGRRVPGEHCVSHACVRDHLLSSGIACDDSFGLIWW